MKKHALLKIMILILLFLLIIPFSNSYASPRPKVAVVLSGGGAKGVAHIGALKVIEEAGIPIDYIVGTSIGAIVGGLYSIGYSTEQLEELVKQTDWMDLLSDKVSREVIPFPFKAENDRYLLSFPLNNDKGSGGIIKGENIWQLLNKLTEDYQNVTDFEKLPTSFACIATDMVSNEKVIIRSGNLAEAMRASMAVPVAFTPVYSEGKVLIDGGFKDNLPIDVAKDMGADIVIAIDAQSDFATGDKLKSVPDVINQMMLMICQSELDEDKVKQVDSYIKVNVDGYNAASFSKDAIDSLLVRGENAARNNYGALLGIKEKVGISTDVKGKIAPHVLTSFQPKYALSKIDKLSVGLRFDSEDIAAIMLAVNLRNLNVGEMELALRGGRQSFLYAKYGISFSKLQRIAISNKFGYSDIFLYDYGRKVSNPTFLNNISKLTYSVIPIGNLYLEADMSLDYYRFFKTLAKVGVVNTNDTELFLNYEVGVRYETLNRKYFPTKGMDGHIKYKIYTDCRSVAMYSALDTRLKGAFHIKPNTALISMLYGRFLFNSDIPFVYRNMIGGEGYAFHYEQQMPFCGVVHTENIERMFGTFQLKIQQRISGKQYLTLSGNYAYSEDKLSAFFHGKPILGTSLGYGLESPIGPVEGVFCFSNRTNKIGFYLNVGWGF